jgi:glycine/D-amino acid oxidase-like deaminating enzyme
LFNRPQNIEVHLLSDKECFERFPYIRVDDIEGGMWVPNDGIISPTHLLATFAEEARKTGIQIVENCEVQRVLVKTTHGGQYFKVRGVETSLGLIECDVFVNCAGIVINWLLFIFCIHLCLFNFFNYNCRELASWAS